MLGRVCVVAVVSTVAFGAAEAQAGTVFRMCWDVGSPIVGCVNTFAADQGQQNAVEITTDPDALEDTFREPGRLIRPISGTDEFEGPDAGEHFPAETATRCRFFTDSATCAMTGPEGAFVYLRDMDDTATVNVVSPTSWAPRVYGEVGNDVVHSNSWITFAGGPGADDLIAPRGALYYPAEPGVTAPMELDADGVADDGRPGEGDNWRPGYSLQIALAGNHRITGHDGSDSVLAGESIGDLRMNGLGGDDFLAGGPGDDRLDGGSGDDTLQGGWGADDVLIGGPGEDIMHGLDGDDTFRARDGERDDVVCGAGTDTAFVDAIDFIWDPENCERVVLN